MVIEVSFKGNRREFFDWPFEDAPAVKTPVVVEVERGEDIGRVHATGDLALKRKAGTTHGKATPEPLRKAIRAANGDEITRATQLRAEEYNVRIRAIEKVRTLGLDLKISDTEWQYDKKRLTVFFTAEQRVDFRQLVRQLEGLFGTRVHMWHIGVRDEAKRVDGVGRCGRQLCSASWLPELIPVKSSVAKDQHLSTLNPAQISGACGRLMCCLRYEHEFYVQQRKRFPKEGKIITTAAGEEKVVSLDIFRETVTLRSPIGESRVLPLVQLRQEMAGEPVTVVDAEPDTDASVDTGEEEGLLESPGGEQHRMEQERVEPRPEPRPAQQPRQERGPRQEQRPPRQERPRQERGPRQEQKPRQEQRPPRQERGQKQGQQGQQGQRQDQRPPRPEREQRGQPGPRDQQHRRDVEQPAGQQPSNTPAPSGGTNTPAGGQPESAQGAQGEGAGRRRRRGRRGGRRGNRGPNGQGGAQGGENNDQQSGPSSGGSGSDGVTGGTE